MISKKLPDSHSDFVYALISEELGIIVAIIILFLYMIPYIRIHYICQRSSNLFIITSLTGLSNIFLFQTIINIFHAKYYTYQRYDITFYFLWRLIFIFKFIINRIYTSLIKDDNNNSFSVAGGSVVIYFQLYLI